MIDEGKTKLAELMFVGDWKKLIPMGYRFQRLYARNYISYYKGVPGFSVWIWKKGKSVELDGSSAEETALIYKYLVENSFKIADKFNRLVINKQTNSIEDYNFVKHHPLGVYGLDCSSKECNELCNKYKEKLITEEMIMLLKELHDNHFVEVKEE